MIHPEVWERIRRRNLSLLGFVPKSFDPTPEATGAIRDALASALALAGGDSAGQAAAWDSAVSSVWSHIWSCLDSQINAGESAIQFLNTIGPDENDDWSEHIARARQLKFQFEILWLALANHWNRLSPMEDPAGAIRWMRGATPP